MHLPLLCCLISLLLAAATSAELDVGEEKNWMPWPTSLKDPKKEYVTVTLPAETLTETEVSTSTSTLTKIVYSHTTSTLTSITDKTMRVTETATHSSLVSKTYTSLQVEKVSVTSTVLSTTTTSITHTFTWQDGSLLNGEQASSSLRLMRHARQLDSTVTVSSQPTLTTTATRLSVQRGRSTMRSVLTTTSMQVKMINRTAVVVSTQLVMATRTESLIVSTTITSFY